MSVSIGDKAYMISLDGDVVRVLSGTVVCRTERLNEPTSVTVRTATGSAFAALEDEVCVKSSYDYTFDRTIGAKVLALLEPKQPPADVPSKSSEPVIGSDGKEIPF